MDCWRTALLGSAAAVAMLAGEPTRAISINDPVAAAFGGIANYYDAGNQFPNVVSLFNGGSQCTGSLINSRTILTAAHCFVPNLIPSISFAPPTRVDAHAKTISRSIVSSFSPRTLAS